MNVEARQESVEPEWQGELINGVYPLHRRLDGSDRSLVFLTESKALNLACAALKIVPIERVTLAQLSHWNTTSSLSHPNLIRLFDAGLCQIEGRQFLFVVMEYAEQTLAQVLPNRALTPDEVRDLLLPTLDALAYLHARNLVHGQLKPTNLLVVNDQLKLASDTVRPAGAALTDIAGSSPYDPPETKAGKLMPASDIWSLGVTLVQALTQRLPAWPDERSGAALLPADLPSDFLETVQRCLSPDPSGRPTAAELQTRFKPAPQVLRTSFAEPVPPKAAPQAAPHQNFFGRRAALPAIAVLIILLVAIWGGLRLFEHPSSSHPAVVSTPRPSQAATVTAQAAAQKPQPPPEAASPAAISTAEAEIPLPPRPVSRRPDRPAQPPTDAGSSSVVHEEIPTAARSALGTIHGHVRVAVLVSVDRSGAVVDASLENPGPSWYFARLAREAATKWRFVPADDPGSRTWRLRFVFTPEGATARATVQP